MNQNSFTMKTFIIIFLLIVLPFFTSCGNHNRNSIVDSSVAFVPEDKPSEKLFVDSIEPNFEMLWTVFRSIPEDRMPKSLRYKGNYVEAEKRMRENWEEGNHSRWILKWSNAIDIVNTENIDMYLYKYSNANAFLVIYQTLKGGESLYVNQDLTYRYDLVSHKLTETQRPIDNPSFGDFFDPIELTDTIPSAIDDFSNTTPFINPSENGFRLLYNTNEHSELSERGRQLSYIWDGTRFRRDPQGDGIAPDIHRDGFAGLRFGTKMPKSINGYEIVKKSHMAEGEEEPLFLIRKNGTDILEIRTKYDFNTEQFTDLIDDIIVYSDKYMNSAGYHVGDSVSKILKNNNTFTRYDMDGDFVIDLNDMQYFVDRKDYQGIIPTIKSSEGAIVKHPNFKADAKIKAIRIYDTKN